MAGLLDVIDAIASINVVLTGKLGRGKLHHAVNWRVALGAPVVSPLQKIEEVSGQRATVQRVVDDGFQRIEVLLPAVLGISSEMNEPRYPPLKGIMAAGRAQIPVWTLSDLGLTGLASRVKLRRLYVETREARVELIDAETPAEAGAKLADALRNARLV